MVRVTGLEPAVSWSQTTRDTKLRYTRMVLSTAAAVRCNVDYYSACCREMQEEILKKDKFFLPRPRRGILSSPDRPLTQRGHRFLCERKRWERKRRGGAAPSALPPMRNRARVLLRWDCASPVPFEPGFPPMRKALYCHARQVTTKTGGHRPKNGAAP